MASQITIYDADGVTAAAPIAFGTVTAGKSASVTKVLKNTGDSPALAVQAGFLLDGADDLEEWVTVSDGTHNGTYASPANLGDIAVGASVNITITVSVPAGTPASSTQTRTILYAEWG